MRHISAQYTITNTSAPLKRAVITTEDDGTIINIKDTGGNLTESASVEFYNGILVPGFVNCHCHLELSHMRGFIPQGGGLGTFLKKISALRDQDSEKIIPAAIAANTEMCKNGIVLCADICNTSSTFAIKKKSTISYISLLEVFGTDPELANRKVNEIMSVADRAKEMNLPFSLVPHTAYTVSVPLFRILREKSKTNKIISMHFMETQGEASFIERHSGPLMDVFKESGLIPPRLETVESHTDAVLNELTPDGNLILVHNTFADINTIRKVRKREHIFWCLCPKSNKYIENKLPPVKMLIEEGCELVVGTDSLASNTELNILEELKLLQESFPHLSITDLVCWATYNGARALGEENSFGTIETGKKPGILLIDNVDLLNMKLLPESSVSRLI